MHLSDSISASVFASIILSRDWLMLMLIITGILTVMSVAACTVDLYWSTVLLCPRPLGGGIKQRCCLTSDDVCRVHHEYSWDPQLLEARHAGRHRPGVRRVWAAAGPQRTGVGAYHCGGSLQLVVTCISANL